jgi:PmbA protein
MEAPLLAEDIIKKALKKDCDEAEVFIKKVEGISAEAKDGKIDALKASRDLGIALKVIKNQRVGFSFTTNPAETEKTIEEAIQGANWTAIDIYVDIPEPMPLSQVSVFDERIKNVKEDDVIKNALFLEESALAFDRRIKKVRKAEVKTGLEDTTIFNSKGVNVSYESSYMIAQVIAFAHDNKDEGQVGWDFAISRRMSGVDLGSVGAVASKRAIELLGSRKISAVKVPVILDPSVAVEFLDVLSASLSAEAVLEKRSFLAGKVGKTIVSPLLDVIDSGTMPWGIGTKPVDDEGVPASDKTVISKGILTGFIHNTYTAKKMNAVSTGNAVRSNPKSLPQVDVTNLYIKPLRTKDNNRLIKSISRGLLILSTMGVHTADPISGDFSIGISGLWIERGETVYPIKEALISGNILDLFKKVEDIGSDLRFYGNTGSPSLLIGEMDISA